MRLNPQSIQEKMYLEVKNDTNESWKAGAL